MDESPPFYKRPWVWVVFGIVAMLAPLGVYLSQQVGDPDWWKREATAYNRRHAVPDEENAGLFYRTLSFYRLKPTNEIWPWEDVGFCKKDWRMPMCTSDLDLLARFDNMLAQLVEESKKPKCFYPLDPNQPLDDRMARFFMSEPEQATEFLALRALREASQGQPEKAVPNLLAGARLGFHHDQLGWNTGPHCRTVIWTGIERLVMDTPPSPDTLETMVAELQTLSSQRPSQAERWERDRLFHRGLLESCYRPFVDPALRRAYYVRSTPYPLFWLGQAFTRSLEGCRRDINEAFAIVSNEKPTAEDRSRLRQIVRGGSRFSMGIPSDTCLDDHWWQMDLALDRGTRILLLVKAYRLRHGSYPESLEILKASTKLEIPDDPYSGKPFIYKRLDGDRFLLYSIGQNGKDDGGKDGAPPFRYYKSKDFVLGRLPRPYGQDDE